MLIVRSKEEVRSKDILFFKYEELNEVKEDFDKGINDQTSLGTPSKGAINGKEIQELKHGSNVEEPEPNEISVE